MIIKHNIYKIAFLNLLHAHIDFALCCVLVSSNTSKHT